MVTSGCHNVYNSQGVKLELVHLKSQFKALYYNMLRILWKSTCIDICFDYLGGHWETQKEAEGTRAAYRKEGLKELFYIVKQNYSVINTLA